LKKNKKRFDKLQAAWYCGIIKENKK